MEMHVWSLKMGFGGRIIDHFCGMVSVSVRFNLKNFLGMTLELHD
jgi:hypothetical protein